MKAVIARLFVIPGAHISHSGSAQPEAREKCSIITPGNIYSSIASYICKVDRRQQPIENL